MNPYQIIDKYYPEDNNLKRILLTHSELVAEKVLDIARRHPELSLDEHFLYEAAMLHDIGIFRTNAPAIYCIGTEPYLCHGVIGGEIMRAEGYPRHARVCERHTGTGLTAASIKEQGLPLPVCDLLPETQEEQAVCFADKFFSKTKPDVEKTVEQAFASIRKFGVESEARFKVWEKRFL